MYSKIASIETPSAKRNPVTFELWERGAATANPMPKFPVYGYRLRFNFSQFGFGVLNSSLTLDIVDTDTDLYYSKFNNVLRNLYGVRITVDGKEVFWGFPDKQQITRRIFATGIRGVRVVFYNPIQYLQQIEYDNPLIYDALKSTVANSGTALSPSAEEDLIRYGRFFQDFVFADFLQSPSFTPITKQPFTVVHNFIPGVSWDSEIALDNQQIFNGLFFDRRIYENSGLSVAEVFNSVIRYMWCRAGYSITDQAPCIYQMDEKGTADIAKFGEVIPLRPNTWVPNPFDPSDLPFGFINEITRSSYTLPELKREKFLRGTTATDVNPYREVTYFNPAESFTAINANIPDPFLADRFGPFEIVSDAAEAGNVPERLRMFSVTGTTGVLVAPLRFFDLQSDPSAVNVWPHPRLIANLHADWRNDVRVDLRGTYDGILDPMRNYSTDFDANTYIITRGEYDVFREQTTIIDSISI